MSPLTGLASKSCYSLYIWGMKFEESRINVIGKYCLVEVSYCFCLGFVNFYFKQFAMSVFSEGTN